MVSARRRGEEHTGVFVVGGRMREAGGRREILNDAWFCDCSSDVRWQRLADPPSTLWQPRFHFAAAQFHGTAQGIILFGGNVSTGLLKLPVDVWLYREHADDDGYWAEYEPTGPKDAAGSQLPYGRVHASLVYLPLHRTLLLFGGESTRPYMYHGSVLGAVVPEFPAPAGEDGPRGQGDSPVDA